MTFDSASFVAVWQTAERWRFAEGFAGSNFRAGRVTPAGVAFDSSGFDEAVGTVDIYVDAP